VEATERCDEFSLPLLEAAVTNENVIHVVCGMFCARLTGRGCLAWSHNAW
jgi:hypothetical protein